MSRRELLGLAAALPLVLAACAAADDGTGSTASDDEPPDGVGSFDVMHGGRAQHCLVDTAGDLTGDDVLAVVLLHGNGQSATQWTRVGLVEVLDRLGDDGRAVVAVAPDLVPTAFSEDFVTESLVPEIRTRFAPDRLGISGISRGGAAALDLALGNPEMFRSVGLHSPASALSGTVDRMPWRCWLDIGDADYLLDGALMTAETLRRSGIDIVEHVWEGEHVEAYWKRHLAQYFDFHLGV